MAKENLMLLVNGADDNTVYSITTQYDVTMIDEFDYGKDKVPIINPWNDEYNSLDDALSAVVNARGGEDDIIIKAFKHYSDCRVDARHAWAITKADDVYRVMTERDGCADEVKIEQANGEGTTMPSLGAAVDFVSFLERVYSEHNPLVGQRTVAYGMMCDKAVDILNAPFDVKAMKLIADRAQEAVER